MDGTHRNELSAQDGCILQGSRVIIPPAGRQSVLTLLYEGHLGISRMKSLARSFVWWSQIDKDLEDVVKSYCHAPPSALLHPWEWPRCPWSRLCIDYAGRKYATCCD